MNFSSHNIIVTGGANGIGLRIVKHFLERGANVAVIDKDAAAGGALAAEHGVFFLHGDISEEAVLTRFADAVKARFGVVHALVNNACLSRGGMLSGCSWDDFLHVQKVGVAAPYFLTRCLMDAFAPGASVVNIASTRALMSQPDTESYTAAKGGIAALTHALAASLAGRARVNAISPGWIDNAGQAFLEPDRLQHPAGRVGTPDDIAKLVLFLCGPDAGFITGQNFVVDGGMTKLMIYHGDHGWRKGEEATKET